MPGDSVALAPTGDAAVLRIGFHGKIPARGDFVRWGLPGSFIRPWDSWVSEFLVASRQHLGPSWPDAWRTAPPWRFLLAPGVCGPDPAMGVWLPSHDRVGRAYALTLAALGDSSSSAGGFLARAERAGRAAVAEGLDPATIGVWLAERGDDAATEDVPVPQSGSLWRQAGGPWRPFPGLPDAVSFAAILPVSPVAP